MVEICICMVCSYYTVLYFTVGWSVQGVMKSDMGVNNVMIIGLVVFLTVSACSICMHMYYSVGE